MKIRVRNITELQTGDRIWSIGSEGNLVILQFVSIHPETDMYSLMLNDSKDAPKFYNKELETRAFYRYDGSRECWNDIYAEQRDYHLKMVDHYETCIKENVIPTQDIVDKIIAKVVQQVKMYGYDDIVDHSHMSFDERFESACHQIYHNGLLDGIIEWYMLKKDEQTKIIDEIKKHLRDNWETIEDDVLDLVFNRK